MDNRPSPGNGNEHGRNDSFPYVLKGQVESLEKIYSHPVLPVEGQMDESIEIGSAQDNHAPVAHNLDNIWVFEAEDVGDGHPESDDHADPDSKEKDVAGEHIVILIEMAAVVEH